MAFRKYRLLDLLASRYSAEPRDALFARILCGEVMVNGETVRNPKTVVGSDAVIEFAAAGHVSRGGNKLCGAIAELRLQTADRVFLDAGSSTGGFTDCLLRSGASAVHAVDVGWNQLDYRLRTDPRVHVHEKTNIMHVQGLQPEPEAAVADLSFRSLRGAAHHILSLTSAHELVALVKPQYELTEHVPEFNGVVREAGRVETVLTEVVRDLATEHVFVEQIVESPLRGRKGNREFFFRLTYTEKKSVSRVIDELRGYVHQSQSD